jgi:glycosyltransferase involved in cell wall biosynthesis
MLEAMACGTPIAAYPVTGPTDIIIDNINGCMSDNLEIAVEYALKCDRKKVYELSKDYTWTKCTDSFMNNLQQIESR